MLGGIGVALFSYFTSLPMMRRMARQPLSLMDPHNERGLLIIGHFLRIFFYAVVGCQSAVCCFGFRQGDLRVYASVLAASLPVAALTVPLLFWLRRLWLGFLGVHAATPDPRSRRTRSDPSPGDRR